MTPEEIARQVALREAVRISIAVIATDHTGNPGVVEMARLFYDFLKGDVETESESSE